MGARRIRRDQRRVDMQQSRIVNGHWKDKERVRRLNRLKETIRTGQFPYHPAVMNWLSVELSKPTSQITAEEAKQWLAQA